jgi:tRNA-dihydrouridine synthase B
VQIGAYTTHNNLLLAPMAGVTDWPFRRLCSRLGAGMVVSEMMSANPELRDTQKSMWRGATHQEENSLRSVQIAGGEPKMMAEAAKYNVGRGAQIIDINMGCPAKKVCKLDAGSALLKNEKLVAGILDAVVNAVEVPVTLKIRTGWDSENRNALNIAQLAEAAGIAALTIHGRTREQKYTGNAEYETIKTIKKSIKIPVIANGDINCSKKAKYVLEYTNADAIMIGRAAQGKPWIFREIAHFLQTGEELPPPSNDEILHIMYEHLENLYSLYGSFMGVKIARKHVGWYCENRLNGTKFRRNFNSIDDPKTQLASIQEFLVQPNRGS